MTFSISYSLRRHDLLHFHIIFLWYIFPSASHIISSIYIDIYWSIRHFCHYASPHYATPRLLLSSFDFHDIIYVSYSFHYSWYYCYFEIFLYYYFHFLSFSFLLRFCFAINAFSSPHYSHYFAWYDAMISLFIYYGIIGRHSLFDAFLHYYYHTPYWLLRHAIISLLYFLHFHIFIHFHAITIYAIQNRCQLSLRQIRRRCY